MGWNSRVEHRKWPVQLRKACPQHTPAIHEDWVQIWQTAVCTDWSLGASFFSFPHPLTLLRRSHGTGGKPTARPQSDQNLCVCVLCPACVCVFAVWMMRVCVFNLIDFIWWLLIVCVFAVRVEGHIFALAVRVCYVIMRQIFLYMCVWRLWACSRVDDLVDPAPEAADSRVERRWGRIGAAVTPGDNASEDPSTCLRLTH